MRAMHENSDDDSPSSEAFVALEREIERQFPEAVRTEVGRQFNRIIGSTR